MYRETHIVSLGTIMFVLHLDKYNGMQEKYEKVQHFRRTLKQTFTTI